MKIGVTICACLLSASLLAQETSTKKVLTFEEAVKIAMKNSVLLNQQKNNLELNQMQRTGAFAGLAPTLSAQATAQEANGNFFNQNEGKVINGITDRVSASLNANITLFNGLGQVSRIRQYSNLLEAQSYYVNRTAQDVINTISGQYLTVLLDEELYRIAQKNFEVLSNQLKQVTEQVNLGAKSPVDGFNQSSQTKAAEIRMLQAEITLMNDKATLTQTLLLDPAEDFDVVKPNWDVNGLGEEREIQTLFEVALQNRGDYLRAKKNEQASKYATRAALSSMTPTISAFGTLFSAYNKSHGDPAVRPFSTQFKTDNLQKIFGVQLYIPILGGNQVFQNRTAWVQQKVLYHNNQLNTRNVEVQVKADVVRTYRNYNLYKKTFSVSLEQLNAAETAFGYEKERYELGVTNFVDFITANKNLVQAQTDKAQAEYRLLFQKVLMDYATGTLKPETIE